MSYHNHVVKSVSTMVERRFLTSDYINGATPPAHGERWIADTKLRGFGLRLWQTTRGEGKAYAIRVIDKQGRSIRRTYDSEARNAYWWPHRDRRSLGDVLEDARDWAADELCRAKGKPTLRQEEDNHRKRVSSRLSRLTLDDLVQARFRGMRVRGLTEQYIVTLIIKLYEQHIPSKLRQTKISKVKPHRLAIIFRLLKKQKPGSARTLRAFLGQIIKDVGLYSLPLYRAFYYDREFPAPPRNAHSYRDERQFSKEVFAQIFDNLSRRRVRLVPSAICPTFI